MLSEFIGVMIKFRRQWKLTAYILDMLIEEKHGVKPYQKKKSSFTNLPSNHGSLDFYMRCMFNLKVANSHFTHNLALFLQTNPLVRIGWGPLIDYSKTVS